MRHFGLHARRSLGQHFLIDEEVLKRIISAAELTPNGTVIEVGPGLGVLTCELAKWAGRVIAIEVDAKLASALAQVTADFPRVSVINADVLQVDPAKLLAEDGVVPASHCYKLVANLPYYITSPTLRHFLEASLKPQRMVVMVQKEVGETIAAQPGELSLLSIGVQFYGKPTIIDYVPARSFYPPPKVDSVILCIDLYQQPAVEVTDTIGFFNMVRAGFAAPRKQLRNTLAQGLGIPSKDVEALLEKAEINSHRRAETLSLQEWARLYAIFADHGYN